MIQPFCLPVITHVYVCVCLCFFVCASHVCLRLCVSLSLPRKSTLKQQAISWSPPNQGGYRAGKSTWENAARFAYDVYEGFQRKEQTLAVAVDLEDAYNRVQFKLLMELLRQYGVSLTLTRWLAAALQERKVAMRLGNWISTPQQLTMGLPQGSPLSPVLYNVYTKGLADLNSNGLSRVLTLADAYAYLQNIQ